MTQPDKLTVKEFEAEFEPRGFDMRKGPGDYYTDLMTEGAWRGWQAALQRSKQLEAAEILCRAGDAIFATDESTESAIKAAIQHVSTKTPLPTIDYSESQSTVCPHCQGHWYGCSKNQRLCSEGK